ncbi:MAG: glycosyltransferase family 9 protein [Planctomycetes bacterium]|nr:glycosyltransferase family 9 protein [Planctomycetota bacterium]
MRASLILNDFDPARILIIKPSAIGDIANSLPFLRGVRKKYPEAKISWLINQSYEAILTNHPDIDEVFSFDRNIWKKNFGKSLSSSWKLVQNIRTFKPTLTIDLQCLLRTGILARLSGAPVRIGLEDCREGSKYFYTHLVRYPFKGMHAVERYWEAAKFLGCKGEIPPASFPIDEAENTKTLGLISRLPKPWIGCCPGARWLTKQWPASYYARTLQKAQTETSGGIVLFGGNDDSKNASEILSLLPVGTPAINLTGKTSLRGLIAVISIMDFIFSNDTGPLHIAVAQGKKVISPFLCTKVEWNGPYGQFQNTVSTSVPCKGSYLTKCPKMICMDDLVPEKMFPLVESTVQAWRSSKT